MRRFLPPVVAILIVLVALSAFVLWGEHGRASIDWLGWRADTTASVLVGAGVALGAVVALVLVAGLWLARTPRRFRRTRTEAAGRGRLDALTRGYAALAAGDAAEARRQAIRAKEGLVDDDATTGLVQMLVARAADDDAEATLAYETLLPRPETAPAGRRGLAEIARRVGDHPALVAQAEAAYAQSATAVWAWRVLFEDRLRQGDKHGARALIDTAERRGTLPKGGAAQVRVAIDGDGLDAALNEAERERPADDAPLALPKREKKRWMAGF